MKIFGRKIEVIKAKGFRKFSGLMFKFRTTKPLLFEFSKESRISIHSLFVFFDFIALWFDKDKKIVDIMRIKPFSLNIKPKKKAKFLIEVPVNNTTLELLKLSSEKQKSLNSILI